MRRQSTQFHACLYALVLSLLGEIKIGVAKKYTQANRVKRLNLNPFARSFIGCQAKWFKPTKWLEIESVIKSIKKNIAVGISVRTELFIDQELLTIFLLWLMIFWLSFRSFWLFFLSSCLEVLNLLLDRFNNLIDFYLNLNEMMYKRNAKLIYEVSLVNILFLSNLLQ